MNSGTRRGSAPLLSPSRGESTFLPFGIRPVVAAILFALAPGCDGSVDPQSTTAARLAVHGSPAVVVREQMTLEVVAFNEAGVQVAVPELTWRSSDVSIATVDRYGSVTGHSLGRAMVTAVTAGGLEATSTFDVVAKSLKLSVDQTASALLVGDTAILTVTMLDGGGFDIPGRPLATWESGDHEVVQFRGLPKRDRSQIAIIGVGTGLAVVTARVGNLTKDFALAVVPEYGSSAAVFSVTEFFFEEWQEGASGSFVYAPSMRVSVAGLNVELLRLEMAVPGINRTFYPPLCTAVRLSGGTHTIVGHGASATYHDLQGRSPVWLTNTEGVALITYRDEGGLVRVAASRGHIASWDYGITLKSQVSWQPCS